MVWDTLYIQTANHNKYWKMPNQKYTSWVPKIRFRMDYDPNKFSPNYIVEYFNPDGSLWYSEQLKNGGADATMQISFESNWETTPEMLNTRSSIATGFTALRSAKRLQRKRFFRENSRSANFLQAAMTKTQASFSSITTG